MGNVPAKETEASNEQGIGNEERPMAKALSRPRHHISRPCECGYDIEQFEDDISENFHCAICTNVFKDPVMCFRNEHIFCRACITKYLAKSRTCPTCIEPLTVDTLRVPPRIVLNCLSEFKIRCDFYNRGCGEIVQLGKLETHVEECDFAPVVCSNKGCQVEVSRRDITYHETSVCEMRNAQCHNCVELTQEMETAMEHWTTLIRKLDGIEKKQDELIVNVNDRLNKLELNAQQLEADNKEIKKNLNLVVEHLGRSNASSNEASFSSKEKQKSSIASKVVKSNPKVIVAGGKGTGDQILSSVEMFDVTKEKWTMLQAMKERRTAASSVVYNNQIIVSGGLTKTRGTKTMEVLLSTDLVTKVVAWKQYPALLPYRTYGHNSLVYDDQLITVGGFTVDDNDVYNISKEICDVNLAPPYSLKPLAYMKHKRLSPGVHLIHGSKLVVVGGETFYECLDSVLLYDLVQKKSTELAPLPYPVSEMATVCWGDNIMIIGGAGFWSVFPRKPLQVLDRVFIYSVRTQSSREMRNMKHKRRGATAVKVGNNVYVMGGVDENGKELNSVECYNIERNIWQEVSPMHKARYQATAVVC